MKKFSLAMDSSQIQAFRECQTKWLYAYLERITKKGFKREPFDRGTIIHGLLERYYTHLFYHRNDMTGAQKYAIEAMKDEKNSLGLDKDEIKFLISRFINYTMVYYGNDFVVESTKEGKPAIELGFSIPILDDSQFLFVLEGRIDLLGTLSGRRIFVDHKTQARDYKIYGNTIQFMNYAIATGFDHGMINYIGLQKNVDKNTFSRDFLTYPQDFLKRWKSDLIKIFYKASNAIKLKEYEMNQSQCQGKFGMCQFTRLCETVHRPTLLAIKNNDYELRKEWSPWSLCETDGGEE